MYINLGLLKFKDMYQIFLLKFLHFILYTKFDLFLDNFSSLLPSNVHNTRNRINLPNIGTEVERRFVIFKCCELIRNIPEELLLQQSKYSLKTKYIKLIHESY